MITDQEFAELLADPTKEIIGDIRWTPSDTHRWAREFAVDVESATSWPLRIEGWWNPMRSKLSYTLLHGEAGRIVGLCLSAGDVHHRPTCKRSRRARRRCDCPRGTHKHRWTERFRDQWVYAPSDITADAEDPSAVWGQFCAEINLAHRGILH